MRATFEAALPDEDAVVRRVASGRAQRAEGQSSLDPRGGQQAMAPRRFWVMQPGLGLAFAGLVVAVGLVILWRTQDSDRVAIGPSLARDLAAQAEQARQHESAEHDAARTERTPVDRRGALPTPSTAAEARKASPQSRERASGDERSAEVPAAASTDARWADVTAAMRKQDWKAAERALAPLIQSDDPETRDGARLVRVRLQLRTAPDAIRDPIWGKELSDLATSGSTSSIRASARRLLEPLQDGSNRENSSPGSSDEPAEPPQDIPSREN